MTSDKYNSAQPRPGHIVCLSTPLRPNCIHIGMTSKSISGYLAELNDDYPSEDLGMPAFQLEWSEPVDDIVSVDLQLEEALEAFRDTQPGSYFICAPEDAYTALKVVLEQRRKARSD